MPDEAAATPESTTGTTTVKIPFLSWVGRAWIEVPVPSDVLVQFRLRAAVEIAHRGGASLAGASLDGASLDGARLDGANLNGASLVGASLVGASLAGASLVGARLDDANLNDANLNDANLVGAILDGASLDGANLVGAILDGASLDGANLNYANLNDANLNDANLDGASLNGANLNGASLNYAGLDGANLDGASLVGANLDSIRNDFWDVLLRAQAEIPGLLAALREGRVDGSTYAGECACLAGTIANLRDVPYQDLGFANANRPIERWFLGIRKGDTSETNQLAKMVEGWIVEFQSLVSPTTPLAARGGP